MMVQKTKQKVYSKKNTFSDKGGVLLPRGESLGGSSGQMTLKCRGCRLVKKGYNQSEKKGVGEKGQDGKKIGGEKRTHLRPKILVTQKEEKGTSWGRGNWGNILPANEEEKIRGLSHEGKAGLTPGEANNLLRRSCPNKGGETADYPENGSPQTGKMYVWQRLSI